MSQTGRIYKLTVGDPKEGKGFEIQNLTVSFDVVKSSDNSKKNINNATIQIYNLSRENQKFLERPYIQATLDVGYFDTGLKRLLTGEVVLANTKKTNDGTSITELRFEGSYKDLTLSMLSTTIAPNRTCRDAVEEISKSLPNVSKNVLNGSAIDSKLIYGYPLHSSARQALDDLAKCYRFEWQVDNETLYVNDINSSHSRDTKLVQVINERSGLIERPYAILTKDTSVKVKKGETRPMLKQLQLKILLNAELVAGSTIKVQYEDIDAFYRVDEVRHSGSNNEDEWYSDIQCTFLNT